MPWLVEALRELRQWGWALLAVLPFLLVPASHFACFAASATGFVNYDQVYIAAYGREIFERGNGIVYPNAFDPAPDAPVVYFHWLMWLLGFGIHVLALDPGYSYLALGVASAVLCGRLTLALVDWRLPRPAFRPVLLLGAMWGGGLSTAGALASHLRTGGPFEPFTFDPAHGWWFLNWGRNVVFTTEAVYHALVATLWLAVLRHRWGTALVAAAAICSTHPWTAVQVVPMLLAWAAVKRVRFPRPPMPWWFALGIAIACAGTASYYVFLGSIPQHQPLAMQGRIPWGIDGLSVAYAYLPLLLLAVVQLWRRRDSLDETTAFLALSAAVSFVLMKQDLLIGAVHMPVHFTRGYLWLALYLLGLPLLQDVFRAVRRRNGGWRVALVALLALFVTDNAVFLAHGAGRCFAAAIPVVLAPRERDLFARMDGLGLDGVFLCEDARLGYLSAAYTAVRPYVGHRFLTPEFDVRAARLAAWFRSGEAGPWFDEVDLVLFRRSRMPSWFDTAWWSEIVTNDEWRLFRRVRRAATSPADSGASGDRHR
jgi:hypothetical protein